MGRYGYEMPDDIVTAEFVVDALCNTKPWTWVTVWVQGKEYYIEEVDEFTGQLIAGKEVTK